MKSLTNIEDYLAEPGKLSRRSFMGRAAKLSAAAAGVAAGVAAFPSKSYAANYACCTLAWPSNWCQSNYWEGVCPCSDTPYEWTCGYNGCVFTCGECYDCECSYAYEHYCTPNCACSPALQAFADSLDFKTRSMYVPFRKPGERCGRGK